MSSSGYERHDARPRVLLVEDHVVMVDGLTFRLESIGMEVVGVADGPDRCLALYRETEPAFVLCDVGLGKKGNGIDLVRRLVTAHPTARVVMYSAYSGSDLVEAALEAGAVGYILKGSSKSELAELLTKVAEGEDRVFDNETLTQMVGVLRKQAETPQHDPARLSPREQEVLELMVSGVTATKDIASELFVSTDTAKTHVAKVLTKLGVSSRTAAVSKAFNLGLVHSRGPATPEVPRRP